MCTIIGIRLALGMISMDVSKQMNDSKKLWKCLFNVSAGVKKTHGRTLWAGFTKRKAKGSGEGRMSQRHEKAVYLPRDPRSEKCRWS